MATGFETYTSMGFSVRDSNFARSKECVRFSECPLREVPLYIHVAVSKLSLSSIVLIGARKQWRQAVVSDIEWNSSLSVSPYPFLPLTLPRSSLPPSHLPRTPPPPVWPPSFRPWGVPVKVIAASEDSSRARWEKPHPPLVHVNISQKMRQDTVATIL